MVYFITETLQYDGCEEDGNVTDASSTTHTGYIKKINDQRGFGFIISDNALGRDVYFQVKDIVGFPAVKSLPDQAKVTFKLTEHPSGFRATQVKLIQ